MKRWLGSVAALILVAPLLAGAQARPDFTGKWTFNQGKSSRGTSGNSPVIPFPTEMLIKQTPNDLRVQTSTMRQEGHDAVYKFDGSEVEVDSPDGIVEKAKANWDGPKLVISSRRSFSSPIGDVVMEFKETWTLNDSMLTIEKSRTAEGQTDTVKAVFERNAAS